jgi:prevent-host-death family protein
MERIGVREARQNLSVYLQRVKAGEAFTVTEHGHAVALLTPVPPDDDPLADLVAAGRVTPARGPLVLPEPLPPLPAGTPTLSEVLQQMRDEERH